MGKNTTTWCQVHCLIACHVFFIDSKIAIPGLLLSTELKPMKQRSRESEIYDKRWTIWFIIDLNKDNILFWCSLNTISFLPKFQWSLERFLSKLGFCASNNSYIIFHVCQVLVFLKMKIYKEKKWSSQYFLPWNSLKTIQHTVNWLTKIQ